LLNYLVDRINQSEQNNKRFQIECYGKIWAIKWPVKL